jgi:mannosyltransferase
VVFTTATLLTHNTAVFFLLATNLFVLGLLCLRRLIPTHSQTPIPSPRNWLVAQAGIFLLWLPWLPAFISQSLGVYREFWLPSLTLETVVGTVGVFVSEFLLLPLWGLWLVGIFCAALMMMGVVYFRHRAACAMLLLVVFAVPILGAWLVSLRRPILYDRTLIWASLPLYVLLAAGICNFEPQRREGHKDKTIKPLRLYGEKLFAGGWRLPCAIAVTLAILALNGLSLHAYYAHFEKEQWDDAAALVAEQAELGDLILFNATWMQIPFDYYFHQLNTVPVAEHGVPVDLFDRSVLEPKMAESDLPYLRSLVDDRQRVWLVYSHTWYTDPQGLTPLTLEEAFRLGGRWEFYGLEVRLYGKLQ